MWKHGLRSVETIERRRQMSSRCCSSFVPDLAPEEHQRRGDAADALFRGAGLPARIESAFAQNLHRTCFGDSVGVTIRHALGTQGRSDSDDRPSARSENY